MIYFRYLKDLQEYARKHYKDKPYTVRFDSERKMYYISPF